MAEHRIRSLDGARAFSIGLVLFAHLDLGSGVPGLWRVDTGNLGVRVFFVISGFIITTLLLEEIGRTGSLDLIAFYRRRAFRILPAFYAFLAVVLVVSQSSHNSAPWKAMWPAAGFLGDYANIPLVVGHTWSLAVEEQFYLIWPGAIVLLGFRRSYYGCLAILLAAPTFRVLSHLGLWPTDPRYAFECVADALAAGCLLAILRDRLWTVRGYRRLVDSPLALAPGLLALILIAALRNQGLIYYTIGLSLLNVGIAIALDRYMRSPESPIGRVLNLKFVIWLGLVSYSLYLWQQLFAWMRIPVAVRLLLMIGCAAVSYYAVERPFQQLRRRIESSTISRARKQVEAA
jgi:peptidoglycan/LPS O-acetylase OafA/YrhL